MGATKRLLEEPECCGECGAELEWDNGERVCAADCPTTRIDRYERLAMNPKLRAEGWDAFHAGDALDDVPHSGPAGDAWERGWGLAERGKPRPRP